jgi:hypothetical protein
MVFDSHFDLYAWSYKDESVHIRRVRDHQEVLSLPVLKGDTAWITTGPRGSRRRRIGRRPRRHRHRHKQHDLR